MLDDIVLFIHIVQQQGLAPAARALDMPVATVTRRLQRLENSVRCRLIHRTARRFELTSEGEIYFRAYSHLVDQFEQTQRSLSDDMYEMRGNLKVMAPINLSSSFLKPMWVSFMREYPEIQLELILSNQVQDMIAEKADLAIRVGPQADSPLYQKRLGAINTVLVAAPEYLAKNRAPINLEELKQHRLIGAKSLFRWHLVQVDTGASVNVPPVLSTLVNDVNIAASFVREGLGISLLPVTEVMQYIKDGSLIRVLPQWQGLSRDVFAVWPDGRLMNARAKRLLAYIEHYFMEENILEVFNYR
ncbi:MAG: LysR family transcriptional regulator [Marinomonas sp.]